MGGLPSNEASCAGGLCGGFIGPTGCSLCGGFSSLNPSNEVGGLCFGGGLYPLGGLPSKFDSRVVSSVEGGLCGGLCGGLWWSARE